MGKMQVVNRYPWMLAVFSPTQQCPSTTAAAPCCCAGTPGGRLVSRTGSTPSYLDSTDSGASQQGWSGTGIRADGQGWSGTCTRADVQQRRPSPTFSNDLRSPPTLSDAPPTRLRLQRLLCLPHLSCMQAHIEREHVPPALRIDIHHCTLLCAHAQTSKRGGWPI